MISAVPKKTLLLFLFTLFAHNSFANSNYYGNNEVEKLMPNETQKVVPAVGNIAIGNLLSECETRSIVKSCDQDVTIHIGENTTEISTGFKLIDEVLPRDIKGYIYSTAEIGNLSNQEIEGLEEWIEKSLSHLTNLQNTMIRIPDTIKSTISPLYYPVDGSLYMVFDEKKAIAALKINNNSSSFTGYKFYEDGRFTVKVGPVFVNSADASSLLEIFTDAMTATEDHINNNWGLNIFFKEFSPIVIN